MISWKGGAARSAGHPSAGSMAGHRLLAGVSLFALAIATSSARAAERPFTPGWYQQRAQARAAAAATPAPNGLLRLSAAQRAQVNRSLASMARATEAMRAQFAAQAMARAAASLQGNPAGVADGLRAGGLVPYPGAASDADVRAAGLVWDGADLPTEQRNGADVTVTVRQREGKAILTWESFNVGRNTTLDFVQRTADGTPQRDWIALNRVVAGPPDANGRRQVANPSQILGRINADGQVYIINQNGIIFGGASSVNVHSLVASTLDVGRSNMRLTERNAYFRNPDAGRMSFSFQYLYEETGEAIPNGIGRLYEHPIDDPNDTIASQAGFVFEADRLEGSVQVEAGASIQAQPVGADGALGRIALIAPQVVNHGSIGTPDGQTLLVGARNATIFSNETSALDGTDTVADSNLRGAIVVAGALDTASVRTPLIPGSSIVNGVIVPPTLQDGFVGLPYASLNLESSAQAYSGSVLNTGIVSADRGNITMTGGQLTQAGVLAATTSVNANGSIYLRAFDAPFVSVSEALVEGNHVAARTSTPGSVRLTDGSVISILPDTAVQADGAVQTIPAGSRDAFKPSVIEVSLANGYSSQLSQVLTGGAGSPFAFSPLNFPSPSDAPVAGLIDLGSGSLVKAPGASLSLSTSGNPPDPRDGPAATSLAASILIRNGAVVDVSGLMAVPVAMEDNLVTIPIVTANDLADAPLQRDGVLRNRSGLVVDRRASGTRSDGTIWYGTPLFDANGYINAQGLPVEQLLVEGGSVTVSGATVAQAGSLVSVAGGYLQYSDGFIQTSSLISADGGHIFDIARADPLLSYRGIAGQFVERHDRWGQTKTYEGLNLVGARRRFEAGYLEGGDAGSLVVRGPLILEGQVDGGAIQGPYQRAGSPYGDVAPKGATLDFSGSPVRVLQFQPTQVAQLGTGPLASSTFPLSIFLERTWSADWIEDTGAADLRFGNTTNWSTGTAVGHSTERVTVTADTDLRLPPGGSISISGQSIDVAGRITAPSGGITFNLSLYSADAPPAPAASTAQNGWRAYVAWLDSHRTQFTLRPGAVLDVAGLWVNDRGTSIASFTGNDFINGGSVTIQTDTLPSSGELRPIPGLSTIALAAGSVVNVSSGGYVAANGQLLRDGNGVPVGLGGDLSILFHPGTARPTVVPMDLSTIGLTQDRRVERIDDQLRLDGTILANGFQGGGTFALRAPVISISSGGAAGGTGGVINLPAGFFEQGFGSYDLTALLRARVEPGTQIHLQQQQLQPAEQAVFAFSLVDAVTTGFNTGLQRAPVNLALSSLGLVDFDNAFTGVTRLGFVTLRGQAYTSSNALFVGSGSMIEGDPGASVSLASVGQLTFAGTVKAPAGTVTFTQSISPAQANGRFDPVTFETARDVDLGGTALFIAPTASIDVRGTTLLDPRSPFRAGNVLAGGRVSLSAANLVGQPGSRIDVSGTVGVLDLTAPRSRSAPLLPTIGTAPTSIASDAGSIGLDLANVAWSADPDRIVGYSPRGFSSTNVDGLGLFETTLVAAPGGAGAHGGTLSLRAPAVLFRSGAVTTTSGSILAALLQPASLAPPTSTLPVAIPAGTLIFGTDRLAGSGIDSLTVSGLGTSAQTDGIVGFAGDVSLSVARQIVFNDVGVLTSVPANSFNLAGYGAPTSGIAGAAVVEAAYVAIRGKQSLATYGSTTFTAPWLPGSLAFRGRVIDVGGAVLVQNAGSLAFASQSDLRFVPVNAPIDTNGTRQLSFGTVLRSAGDIVLQSAQTYPSTAVRAVVQSTASGGTITFLGNGDPGPLPLAAGGALYVSAAEIVQRGVVRAPLGGLVFGVTNESTLTNLNPSIPAVGAVTGVAFQRTERVEFAAGSLTSTSALGALIPYGQTSNLRDWYYTTPLDTAPLSVPPEKSITIDAPNQTLAAGATLDMRGGGDLYAYEWVPGLGGSINVLATSTNGEAAAPVYAIVPSYAGLLAPVDPVGYGTITAASDTSFNDVGRTLTIGDGIAGLPAGTYLLLPGAYATLPGAYRVQVVRNSRDSLLDAPVALADGTQMIAGRLGDTFGGLDARTQTFSIQSADTWRRYSEIIQTSGTQFFASLAARQGTAAPRLPTDAGRLSLVLRPSTRTGAVGFDLDAELLFGAAAGGRGGEVDIASPIIQVVSAGSTVDPGGIVLTPADIRAFNAESVLLGATRSSGSDGDSLFVIAETLRVATTAADPLTNPELLLAAHDSIDIAPGSVIAARGSLTGPAAADIRIAGGERFRAGSSTIIDSTGGDGTFVRVSTGNAVQVVRDDVRDRSSTSSIDRISIGAGSLLDGGVALQIDSSKDTLIDAAALLGGENIDIAGSQIVFLDPTQTSNSISAAALQLLTNARTLSVRAGQSITFAQPMLVAAGDGTRLERLVLDTPRLVGANLGGGLVGVDATTVVLGNSFASDGSALQPVAGAGIFRATADTLILTGNDRILSGFGRLEGNATVATVFGQAEQSGTLTVPGDVSLSTPLVTLGGGASQGLVATGGLTIAGGRPAVAASGAAGGRLALDAASVTIDTALMARASILDIRARSGDLVFGSAASLHAGGFTQAFFDTRVVLAGGQVSLYADSGSVVLQPGARLDVSADPGGDGGTLDVVIGSAGGTFAVAPGSLSPVVDDPARGGSHFSLDTRGAVNLDPLASELIAGRYTGGIEVVSGIGDLTLTQALSAHDVRFVADGGRVTIGSIVDASGASGGRIDLFGASGVSLSGGAQLLARATTDAGRGGEVTIGTAGTGLLDFATGSRIDVAGGSDYGSGGGRVHLRVPFLDAGEQTIGAHAFGATITDAVSVILEPYQRLDIGTAAYNNGVIDTGARWAAVFAAFTPTTGFGATTAGLQTALGDRFFVMPGLELYNPSTGANAGDITITASLDLVDRRFDGFPGILTVRATGDLRIDASISDGFRATVAAQNTTPSANLLGCANPATCLTSWSYNLVAGARTGSTDPLALEQRAVFETGSLVDHGNFVFGSVPRMGQPTSSLASPLGKNDIIRTGTGWINVSAGGQGLGARAATVVDLSANALTAGFRRDDDAAILFTSPTAVIYTAGVQVESEAGFATSIDDLASQAYVGTGLSIDPARVGLVANRPAFATRGGDLRFEAPNGSIIAQQNYADVLVGSRGALTLQPQAFGVGYHGLLYAGQLFTPWLLSQGSGSFNRSETGVFGGNGVQSARWVLTGAFQQGIAALGGGDVTLRAGDDVDNISVSIVSTYRAVGGQSTSDPARLVTYGGGALTVDAGGRIGTIVTLVDEGSASIAAGETIGATYRQGYFDHNALSFPAPIAYEPVGPMFFIGDASLSLRARGSIDIGAVGQPELQRPFALDAPRNATASPQYARQDLSLAYGEDKALQMVSASGDVAFQGINLQYLAAYGAQAVNPFGFDILEPYVPVDAVAYDSYLPPTVRLAAPQGSITIKDGMFLAPSPVGSLDILAAGSVYIYKVARSIQSSIKLLDVDPDNMAGPLNPLVRANLFNTTVTDPATPVNWRLFGAGAGYALDAEDAGAGGIFNSFYVHAGPVLHLRDRQPARIIALSGDIVNGTNPDDPTDDPLSLLARYGTQTIYLNKGALIYAGRDILNLTYVGFNASVDHVTSVVAGRDITYELGLVQRGSQTPVPAARGSDFIVGGPGQFILQAGRDLFLKPSDPAVSILPASPNGVRAVGNRINPFLPATSADIGILFGVGPGMDQQGFIARYIDPANATSGTRNYLPDLVVYMQERLTLQARERDPQAEVGFSLTGEEAFALFQQLSATEQLPFVQQVLFSEIRIIADQRNNPDQFQNYPRAYQAIESLFPARLGYTDNLATSPSRITVGDFDMLDAVVRTEFGSGVDILGPGGRATLGGLNSASTLPANVQGVFTLRGGGINAYVDGNFDVFNSRVLTLQGGDVTIMSGNGNVDAGRGRNTERVFPPLVTRYNPQTTGSAIDFGGLVSGAGIGTIAAIEGVPPGDVFLLAPRGVIDAGAAGIRATGSLFTVAPTVLNAENIQVGGEAVGISSTSGPPIAALTAAAGTADKATAANDAVAAAAAAQAGQRRLPTLYTMELIGFGGWDGPE